jgi:hypothetical protein
MPPRRTEPHFGKRTPVGRRPIAGVHQCRAYGTLTTRAVFEFVTGALLSNQVGIASLEASSVAIRRPEGNRPCFSQRDTSIQPAPHWSWIGRVVAPGTDALSVARCLS